MQLLSNLPRTWTFEVHVKQLVFPEKREKVTLQSKQRERVKTLKQVGFITHRNMCKMKRNPQSNVSFKAVQKVNSIFCGHLLFVTTSEASS